MKKIVLFLIGVSMILMISTCSKKEIDNNELSDYRPMIYVQDNLYGETADVVSALPDETIYIGTVEKIVLQNEPMVRENFTSNALSVGSEIYYNGSDPDVVYIRLPDTTEEEYSKYIIIQ